MGVWILKPLFFAFTGYLSFANNFFTGVLPTSITEMKDLNRLYLDGNYFNGKLPPGLSDMTNLESISIYNNFFTGTLSPDMETSRILPLCTWILAISRDPFQQRLVISRSWLIFV
jgi:hypothetical protein